jgi:hypothetical protein
VRKDRAKKPKRCAAFPRFRHLGSVAAATSVAYKQPMNDVEPDQLREAIQKMHACAATLSQSVPVRETFEGNPVWEGVVHVFNLAGHPTATRAYAWSSPIEGSTKRRFFAVLHTERINSPTEAVRAAIVAERRKSQ